MDDVLERVPSHLLGYNVTGRIRILFYWIIPTCFQLLAYLIQMSADIGVTYQHFHTNNPIFGIITLTFICLPAIVSFILIILTPSQYPETIGGCCNNNEIWKFIFYQFVSFLIFPIWAIYRFCRRIFWSIESLFYDKDMFERYNCVSIAAESSPFELYHFVQAYTQSAPQIILQLFILLNDNIFRNYETSNIQIVSVIFSLINLSMITVTFQRFESQRIVGGRYLPWSSFHQIQKHKEKLQCTTEKLILPTAGKRQSSSISLRNQQQNRHKSLTFPENDKIFHKFQLQISSEETQTSNESSSQVKNYNRDDYHNNNVITTKYNTMISTSSKNDADDDEIDINKPKKSTSTMIIKENFKNSNNENYNSNEDESLYYLDHNNENVLLAHTNGTDPIPKILKNEFDNIENTDTISLNITDDDKFLKNCQNINKKNRNSSSSSNNNNNNTDGIITTVAEVLESPEKITSKENVKIIENLDKLQIVGTKSENNSLMLNNKCSQIKNNSNYCKNCENCRINENEQENLNEIIYIGEEILIEDNQIIRNSNLVKINFDQVPDIEAPPPPLSPLTPQSPLSQQILPLKFIIDNNNIELRNKDEQLNNNLNPLNRLSEFKDRLVLKAENYIVENIPHPPRYLINKKYSSFNNNIYNNNNNNNNQSKNYKIIKSEYVNNNNNNNNINNQNIVPDTVDFFLPKGRTTINGIEQDDFIGKFIAFFGWLMFIYMRMLSLSVFSIYYLYEFFYILIIHYIIILIILLIDIKEFKKNFKNLPIYIFLSYVYIFVLIEFYIKFHKIRLWYGLYIFIIILENYIITMIWYNNCEFESWWFEYIFITIIGSGLLFISCMIVYYYILRPNDVMLLEK